MHLKNYSPLVLYSLVIIVALLAIPLFFAQSDAVNWQSQQEIALLSNNDFFKALGENPKLLTNENVLASIDVRLNNPDVVVYINKDEKLLQYCAC